MSLASTLRAQLSGLRDDCWYRSFKNTEFLGGTITSPSFSFAIEKLSFSLFHRLRVLHSTSLWSFLWTQIRISQWIRLPFALAFTYMMVLVVVDSHYLLDLSPVLVFESSFYFLRLDRRGSKYLCII